MSPSVIHRYLAYLLIALLPLQAAAAGRVVLCAEMTHTLLVLNSAAAEDCAQMNSMQASSTSDMSSHSDSHKPQSNSGCWLGSICLAGLALFALPSGYTIARNDRVTLVPLPKSTHYHSVIAAVPQRPPAIAL